MATFVMIATDGPNGPALRDKHRSAHIAHVESLHRDGRIIMAGPTRDDRGEQSNGAIIIFDADSLSAARSVVDQDPFVRGGVFESVDVRPFQQILPEPS